MEERAADCGNEMAVCGEAPTSPTETQGAIGSFSTLRSPVKGATARTKAETVASSKASKAEERDAKRHQKALDRQIAKGQKEADRRGQATFLRDKSAISCQFHSQPLTIQADTSQVNRLYTQAWSPDGADEQSSIQGNEAYLSSISHLLPTAVNWEQPLRELRPATEATFTPTVAGLRPGDDIESHPS